MLNANVVSWRRWPRLLRRSIAGTVAVIMLALLYLTLAGTPQPLSPAESLFAPVSVERALLASRPELRNFDFIFRPVFATKRVPPVTPEVEDKQDANVDEPSNDEIVGSINGVTLLGIFGSGAVSGVIIRLDNGERQRLSVGESVKGWTLKSLGSRRVTLEADTGQRAALEMAFATDQTPADITAVETIAAPQTAAVSLSNAAEEQAAQEDGTAEVVNSLPEGTSFESIYSKRYQPTAEEQ